MTTPSDLCPVCGFNLGFPAWAGSSASDEICPSCGMQFGYDDAAGGNEAARIITYAEWRAQWVRDGMPWRSCRPAPPAWDPCKQLSRIVEHEG